MFFLHYEQVFGQGTAYMSTLQKFKSSPLKKLTFPKTERLNFVGRVVGRNPPSFKFQLSQMPVLQKFHVPQGGAATSSKWSYNTPGLTNGYMWGYNS